MVIEAIQKLPDDASLDEIVDRVEFMAAVKRGMDDITNGDIIDHQEVKTQLAKWLTV